MYIIEGNGRKTQSVWEHIKRRHTGDKICVVGFANGLPENYLRNKQVIFYEALRQRDWLAEAETFIAKFEEQFDGMIFYVDCTPEEAERLADIAANYRSRITVTVHGDEAIRIKEHPLKRAA